MIGEHSRFEIWNPAQHPFKHTISGFAYTNPSLPGVSDLEGALNYFAAVLYPNAKPAVATPGDLPAVGNTVNDYRLVLDDGDGKAAGYRWCKWEGEVTEAWHKVYDWDFNADSIVSQFLLKTQDQYAYKYGHDDLDINGAVVVGTFAGQQIYGGHSANTNLTLSANSGDTGGAHTGYVQVDDDFRPAADASYDVGTSSESFKDGWFSNALYVDTLSFATGSITDSTGAIDFGDEDLSTTGTISGDIIQVSSSATFGTLSLGSGSITDSGGSISFGNENLSTTGTLSSGDLTISTTLLLASGSITDSTGAISFGDENLSTTGTFGAGAITGTQVNADNLRLDGNTLSSTDSDGNIVLSADGAGIVDIQSSMTTLGQSVTGTLGVTGQLNIDNLRLDGNTISSTDLDGNILLTPNGNGLVEVGSGVFPTTTSTDDLGKTGNVWNDLWLDGNIKDGTDTFIVSELMDLRNTNWRDAGRSSAVQDGDTLFYDSASGTWLANHPDSEIAHSELAGITTGDAGHTQFALLAGRSGGQTLQGGTDASDNLVLESTSNGTKGTVQTKDSFFPFTNASYSGGWLGADLGGTSNYFRHLYTKGEAKGLRAENFTVATLPSSSATSIGRIAYATDNKRLYIDDGSTFNIVGGINKYLSDLTFNGTDTQKDTDVSANITDARNAVIQLLDNSNDYQRIDCSIKATSASNVRINTNVALPAGSYRLIVIE